MIILQMVEKECKDFLARTSFGRLACVRENVPYIVPVYFAYEPDHLYGFSSVGRKIQWMRANPQVCVEADDVSDHFRWTSVIVSGRYEELLDTPEYRAEREQARMLLEKRFLWWQTAYAALQLRDKSKSDPPLFYCIHVEGISGRKAIPDDVESKVRFVGDPREDH